MERQQIFRFRSDSPSLPEQREQGIPINVFETDDDIVLVCPMPGVEADNIEIEILGSMVTVRASLRGPGQENRRYLLREWSYGPYERTVTLPLEVDATRTNASHGNGVLVLTMPKSTQTQAVRVPLRRLSSGDATHQGHSGHNSGQDR